MSGEDFVVAEKALKETLEVLEMKRRILERNKLVPKSLDWKEHKALGVALFCLRQREALERFCNRDEVAKEKYKTIIDILEGRVSLEAIEDWLR